MESTKWKEDYSNIIEKPSNLKNYDLKKDLNILRVNQLDAEHLDFAINFHLNSYFSKIFLFFDVIIIIFKTKAILYRKISTRIKFFFTRSNL
jgi:hypothetical protein